MHCDVDDLNRLIAIGEDVIEVCDDATDADADTDLIGALGSLGAEYAGGVGALKRCVLEAGQTPTESGTIAGATERAIADVKAALAEAGPVDRALEVLQAHDRWATVARSVILSDLPVEQRKLVNFHYDLIAKSAAAFDAVLRRNV